MSDAQNGQSQYQAGTELVLLIGRMDGKLDTLLAADKEQDIKINDHETRLSALERSWAKLLGVWAAVSAVSGVAGDYFVNHILGVGK